MTRKDLLIGICIFLSALFLRLWQVNSEAINPDEYHWHDRTNLFYHAIEEGRLQDTMTAGHPGATVTWQSMLSLRTLRHVYRLFDPTFDYQSYPYLPSTFDRVHFAYVLPIILITSLFIAFSYFALKQLTNQNFAIISSLLVLSNVYFLAHSRVVQMDALQTSFIIASILTALLFHQSKKKAWFLATGILLGLNVMTKIYGLSILPILWLILCWGDLKVLVAQRTPKPLVAVVRKTFFIILISCLISVLLLPAWVFNFSHTLDAFYTAIFEEGLKGAWEGNEFFWGQIRLNGEPRIFYLLVLWFRQSLISFIALPLTLFLLLKNKIGDVRIRHLTQVFLFSAVYWTLILSIPNKKEDRYILETIVLLDIVSAGGLYWLYQNIKTRFANSFIFHKAYFIYLLTLLIFTFPFLISSRGLGYEYLGYYNPLLGGNTSAVRYIRVGWGEGLRNVTSFFNSLEDVENIRVSSWYEGALAPNCLCEVRPTFRYRDEDVKYVVYYVNQMQRQKEKVMTDKYFNPDDVVFESKIRGLTYAWVVKKPK